jgi:transposase-like protein
MGSYKQYSPEEKEKAIALIATGCSFTQISNDLDIPESTLKTWAKISEHDEDFVEFRLKKKKEFVDNAWSLIEKSIQLGHRRINRALKHEEELDLLIDEIQIDQDIPATTKQSLIQKVKTLQIQTIKDISTFVGTLYDKQALASGEANNKVDITGKVRYEIQLPKDYGDGENGD